MNNTFLRLFFNIKYLGHPPWDSGRTPPELQEFIQSHPAGRALELGCGSGLNVLALARAGWKVTGVDFAWRAIARARKRLADASAKAELHSADVTRFAGPAEPVDLVLDIGCYHSLTPAGRATYRQNLTRWLAPGGYFLLYAHLRKNEQESHGLDERDLSDFPSELINEYRRDSSDPNGRRAVWLLFQAIKDSQIKG